MSLEIFLSKINCTFKAEQLAQLVKLLGGISACFGRRDIAAINVIEKVSTSFLSLSFFYFSSCLDLWSSFFLLSRPLLPFHTSTILHLFIY